MKEVMKVKAVVKVILESSGSQAGATWLTKGGILFIGRKFVPGKKWKGCG